MLWFYDLPACSMGYRELMRRKLLEEIYNRLTTEEKKTFVQLTMLNKSHKEIMETLSRQQSQLDDIEKKQNWKVDFLSDIGANILTDGLI